MGTMTKTIVSGAYLGPNSTDTWFWNNPLHDAVYTFTALPFSNYAPGVDLRIEVSVRGFVNDANSPAHRIEIKVKNLTGHSLLYVLNLSRATP